MFHLMEVLGNRKNNNAPLIYKILINCFTFCGIADRVCLFLFIDYIHCFEFQIILPNNQEPTRQRSGLAFTPKHVKINRTRLYHIMPSNDLRKSYK